MEYNLIEKIIALNIEDEREKKEILERYQSQSALNIEENPDK